MVWIRSAIGGAVAAAAALAAYVAGFVSADFMIGADVAVLGCVAGAGIAEVFKWPLRPMADLGAIQDEGAFSDLEVDPRSDEGSPYHSIEIADRPTQERRQEEFDALDRLESAGYELSVRCRRNSMEDYVLSKRLEDGTSVQVMQRSIKAGSIRITTWDVKFEINLARSGLDNEFMRIDWLNCDPKPERIAQRVAHLKAALAVPLDIDLWEPIPFKITVLETGIWERDHFDEGWVRFRVDGTPDIRALENTIASAEPDDTVDLKEYDPDTHEGIWSMIDNDSAFKPGDVIEGLLIPSAPRDF